LAGILLSKLEAPFVFALNAAGFLVVFMAIPALPRKGCDLGRTLAGFVRSIAISVRYVGQTKNVRNILFRNGVFSSLVVVIPALMPVVLLKELRLDGSSLGLVFASMGVGSVVGAIFVIPWLRSRFATEHLMLIAQITLAGVYVLMAMVHHCLYCLVPMALAGASWTLAASELWVAAQRAMPNSHRGRISALMMVLSQGATTLGAIAWGMSAQIAGTRLTLLAAAFLFCITSVVLMLLFRIPREQSSSPDETKAFAGLKGFLSVDAR
jgi:predicted MFS family arabinose efflux permease